VNYAHRAIERIGCEREADFRGPPIPRAKVAGFTDMDYRVNSGIYLLCLGGRIVRICKVRKNFAEVVAGLRSRPPVLSTTFDQVLIRACHPDEIDSIYSELIATYGAI
jgi:hypothetical protein